MSPSDYAQAGRWRRALERLYRHPAGVTLYYVAEIWFPRMFLVRRSVYGAFRSAYPWDGLLVWAFLTVEIALAIVLGQHFGRTPVEAVAMTIILPFAIWNALMSFVIYLHHTHPEVPWYASIEDWRARNGRLTGTVHVQLPRLVGRLMLNIMDHSAHHYAPGVPLYNLPQMQHHLDDEHTIEWRWSIARYLAVTRACKLFDYERSAWVNEWPSPR